jgi:riboflavin synthase
MFTGLVEAVGSLKQIKRSQGGASFVIECPDWDVGLGDSIAVQGTCLTVTAMEPQFFCCDVLDETLARTNLGSKAAGATLNLERAMQLGDRIGGHLVSGHIDAVADLVEIRMAGRDRILRIDCGELAIGVVEKGSVAIDGISLTVSAVGSTWFEVNIIPFTWDHTSLLERKAGDTINLETDMLGKYVARYLASSQQENGLKLESLAAAGFLAVDTT